MKRRDQRERSRSPDRDLAPKSPGTYRDQYRERDPPKAPRSNQIPRKSDANRTPLGSRPLPDVETVTRWKCNRLGPATSLATASGTRLRSYQNHTIQLSAKDFVGNTRDTELEFVSCDLDIPDVDLILGMPGLASMRAVIDCYERSWHYKVQLTKIDLLPDKTFLKKTKSASGYYSVYTMYFWPAGTANSERGACAIQTKDGKIIPAKYDKHSKVFSMENAGILAPHRTADHKINLQPGTEPP